MRILATLCVLGALGAGCGDVKESTKDSGVADTAKTATLVSIALSGPANLHAGETVMFTALGTYDDATTGDVTSQAQWTSSLPAATVATNQVTGVAVGGTVISATIGSVTANANLTVFSPHVLIATNYSGNSILFFAPNANGNTAPLRTISGALTTLTTPAQVFALNEEVYVINKTSITVFPITGSGNIAPTRTITGALTTISEGRGLTVFNNEIYVGTGVTVPLSVFPANGSGNIAPTRVIGGACQGCTGLVVVNNELYSNTVQGKAINGYPVTASGSAAVPTRSFTDTGFDPYSVFVAGTEIFVSNLADNTMRVYPLNSSGATAPTRTITGFAFAGQPAVFKNELYVSNYSDSSIRVFPITATGAAVPTRTITGAATMLGGPLAVFMY